MKSFLITILILSSQVSLARDFLKNPQKEIALKEIDTICADTWCSGDYNFKFLSIKCDDTKATCQINYEMFVWEQEDAKLSLNCQIKPLKKFSDLVKKTGNDQSLTENFYQKLTECLEKNIEVYGPQLLY